MQSLCIFILALSLIKIISPWESFTTGLPKPVNDYYTDIPALSQTRDKEKSHTQFSPMHSKMCHEVISYKPTKNNV